MCFPAVFLGPLGLDDSDMGPNGELVVDVLLSGEVMEKSEVIIGDVDFEACEAIKFEHRLIGVAADVGVFVGDRGFGDFEVNQGHCLDFLFGNIVD